MGRTSRLSLAAALSMAVFTSACGSSGGTTGQTSQPTAAPTVSGAPIKVGQINAVNSQTLSLPDAPRAAQAAAKAINASGGINGRPLEVVFCDDQNDPNVAATCARKLVNDDHVVALVGGISLQAASLYPILEAAGVVNFGELPCCPQDFSSKFSSPLEAGAAGFAGLASLVQSGITKVCFLHSTSAAASQAYTLAKPAFSRKGVDLLEVTYPPQQVDYQPIIAQVKTNGCQAMSAATAASIVQRMVTAAGQLGLKIPMYINSQITQAAVKQLWDSGADVRVALTFAQDASLYPRRAQYDQEVAKYGTDIVDPVSDNTVNPWLAVHVFADLAKKLKTYDPASFKTLLDSTTSLDTGLTQKIDLSSPPLPAFPRLFNVSVLPGAIKDGKLVQTSNQWFNSAQG
ncbi:MAG TPA: ABC transporter substrate-binding protein [Candidatus Dormibacteraeota bacterium]|jgi:ABC-type branched-subunit amino acid transport system substrate-binding protein|nr:ABC transporter substrate-binding protein [Candidatus Dormibacteraeota bacterium]